MQTQTFVLTGPLEGKTVVLGGGRYPFKNGQLELTASAEDLVKHARFLERNWQAVPKRIVAEEGTNGSGEISEKTPKGSTETGIQAGVQPEKSKPSTQKAGKRKQPTTGDPSAKGSSAKRDTRNVKLEKAVLQLDPENDGHWTTEGLPMLSAVTKIYGSEGVSRSDVEAVLRGYTREDAKLKQSKEAENEPK